MILLGIETSCDETSVCLLKDGHKIVSLLTSSQTQFHEKYGGIVPEVASRQHAETLPVLLHEAMQSACLSLDDISAIAVTHGPGLEGALLVGVSFAKSLSFAKNIPLLGINHLEGHIYANFLSVQAKRKSAPPSPPFLALIASGGHSEIVLVQAHGKYKIIGETVDDAAGECLDKIARTLGLGFPGGAAIEKLAEDGAPRAISFPRAELKGKPFHFSFSGLKTSVLRWLEKQPGTPELPPQTLHNVCASFQEAVVDALSEKTIRAARKHNMQTVLAGGGVIMNRRLRQKLKELASPHSIKVIFPEPEFCTDNAAMIACAGYYWWEKKEFSGLDITVYPQLRLDHSHS